MKHLAVLLGAGLLAGCAAVPRPADTLSAELRWSQHRELLATVLGFELQGRVADSDGRSGELVWRQRADDRFMLQLNGPFGVGAISIEGDAAGVWARTRDGSEFTTDPQGWMQAHLGWHLPLHGMRAWALGLPAPGAVDELAVDADGRLLSLRQAGWTLRYDSYQDVGHLQLPRKLQAQSESVRLRLVIDRWTALDVATRS